MTYGGKMGRGHHMGHPMGYGHHMGHHMGYGHHMGGPMGMMAEAKGICPVCAGMGQMAERGYRHKGPLGLAKIAKKELLIEKIKAKLEERYGDDLDKMADEIVSFAEEQAY